MLTLCCVFDSLLTSSVTSCKPVSVLWHPSKPDDQPKVPVINACFTLLTHSRLRLSLFSQYSVYSVFLLMNPVFFWPPNLIGYGRILSTIVAFCVCFQNVWMAAVLYSIGQLLDAVDGRVARALGMSMSLFARFPVLEVIVCGLGSRFGAMLDMLTDR